MKNKTTNPNLSNHSLSKFPVRPVIYGVALSAAVASWFVREPLQNKVVEMRVLANDAPSIELLHEVFEKARDPQEAIVAAWNTGKIVHRQIAIRELCRRISKTEPLPGPLNQMLLAAALDPDMNVREAALPCLRDRAHSDLIAMAAAQLNDPDPEARRLGLDFLKTAPPDIGVPLVMPILDQGDPQMTAKALKLIEHWTDQQFGLKMVDTIPVENKQTGLKEFKEESRTKARLAAEQAKDWYKSQASKFATAKLEVPRQALAGLRAIPAGDFNLRTLEGKPVRLSDFRGKIVLINFWTTWCTACVGEMPELIELQKRHSDKVAILGISLDYVPDSHGHIGGHGSKEDKHDHADHAEHAQDEDDHKAHGPTLEEIRRKVARTVKTRGINYTISLDEDNTVGGRFNGGELPTTVIVDAHGLVRRRFIGARSLPVFEAMIEEASKPWSATCNL